MNTVPKRFVDVKSYAYDFIYFCNNNPDFDFVIGLDGQSDEFIEFCDKYDIPLVYSEEPEGVGISKNRVFTTWSDYDYYFFVEDDTELLNPAIFKLQIEVSKNTKIPHFSLSRRFRARDERGTTKVKTSSGEFTVLHTDFGSAQYNFFTREALEAVGGWHTEFAKWKRFGHTEHSTRLVTSGLTKYRFNGIEEAMDGGYFRWHDPVSVVTMRGTTITKIGGLAKQEHEIIVQKLKHFPFNTPAKFHYNGKPISFSLEWPKINLNDQGVDPRYKAVFNPLLDDEERYALITEEVGMQVWKLEKEVESLRGSYSYKIGWLLLQPPMYAIKTFNWLKDKIRKLVTGDKTDYLKVRFTDR